MKKFLCVFIAVIVALSSMTIVSFAAKPTISLKTDVTTAMVGDIVKVDVIVSSDSRVCSAQIDLLYDTDCFEIVSLTPTEVMGATMCNPDFGEGKARYAAATTTPLEDEAVLFTAEFKVIKTGGSISLYIDEIYIVNKVFGKQENITDSVKTSSPVTITCAHAFKETTIVAEPTCANEGIKTEKCNECGWNSENIAIPMLEHDKEVVVEEPSCTQAGATFEKCKNCEWKSEEVAIPMLEHEKEEYIIKLPACEEPGIKVEMCKKCDWEAEKEEIPATGHTEGLWIVVKEATKTETGLKQQKCLVCGKVIAEEEIPVLPPYVLGDVNEDGKIRATDARLVLQAVAGLKTLTEAQELAADVNKDGEVTAMDARLILQVVVGKAEL